MSDACLQAKDEMLETAKFLDTIAERFQHTSYVPIHDTASGAGIRFASILYRYSDSMAVDAEHIPSEEYTKYTLRRLVTTLKYYLKKRKINISIEGYVKGAMIVNVDIFHGETVFSTLPTP